MKTVCNRIPTVLERVVEKLKVLDADGSERFQICD